MAKQRGTPIGGPITTQYDSDRYATGFAHFMEGGLHAYASIPDALENLTLDRMHVPMYVSINEDPVNGIPITFYLLKKYPLEEIANPGVAVTTKPKKEDLDQYNLLTITETNWEEYFDVVVQANSFVGEYREEFAPDYDGTYYATKPDWVNKDQPPFPYSKDQTWNDANWSGTLEPGNHRWKRYAYGTGPWSYPIPLTGTFETGDYKKNMFKWATSKPARPAFYVNGVRNSDPTGWSDTRPAKPSGSGYVLWQITTQANVYGIIKLPWSNPALVPLDADLVRYSSFPTPDPNSLVNTSTSAAEGTAGDSTLTSNGWESGFDEESHVYKAQRQLISPGTYSEWEVDRILNESGEYVKDWFRKFPNHLVNYILQNPDAIFTVAMGGDGESFRPQNNTQIKKWSDAPPTTGDGVTFITTQKRFFNDAPAGPHTDPVPFSGENIRVAVITPDPVNDFKYNPNTKTYDVADIDLTAKVFDGSTNLNNDPNVTVEYTWTRIFNNAASDNTAFGTTQTITVNNTDVTGIAIFECVQVIKDGDGTIQDTLTQTLSVRDIHDGIDARVLVLRPQGNLFTKKAGSWSPSSLVITALAPNIVIDGNHVWEYINEVDFDAANPWTTLADTTNELEITSTEFETHIGGTVSTYVIYRCTITDTLGNQYQDEVKFHKTEIEDGQSTYVAILNNDSYILPTDPNGNPLTLGSAKAGYKLLEGTTDRTLDYEGVATEVSKDDDGSGGDTTVTVNLKTDQGNWDASTNTPTLADGTGTVGDFYRVTVAGSQNLGSGSISFNVGDHVFYNASGVWEKSVNTIKVIEWGVAVREAVVTITFSDDEATYPTLARRFQVRRSKGYEDILIADIDIDASSTTKGFVFTPQEQSASDTKVFNALVFKNGVQVTGQDLNDYTFEWFIDDVSSGTGQQITITGADVNTVANVYVIVTETATARAFQSLPIDITDIQEAVGLHILYYVKTTNVDTAPAKPTDPYASASYDGSVKDKWVRVQPSMETGDVLWTSQKRSNEDETNWTPPQRRTGEKGDQGQNGGFYWIWATWYTKDIDPSLVKTPDDSADDIDSNGNLNPWFTDYNGAVDNISGEWTTKKFYKDLNELANDSGYDVSLHNIWITRRFYDRALDGTLTHGGSFEQITQLTGKNGEDGINGTNGTDGTDGRDGNQFHYVANDNDFPKNNLVDKDLAIYKDKTKVPVYRYIASSGSWDFIGNMRGPQGPVGVGLEYDVQSDRIGVKREDETVFRDYTDSLKGDALFKGGSIAGSLNSYQSPSGRWTYVDTGNSNSKKLFISAYAKMENGGHGIQLRIESNTSATTSAGSLIDQSNIRYNNDGDVGMAVVNINVNTSNRYIVLELDHMAADTGSSQRVSTFGLFVEQFE